MGLALLIIVMGFWIPAPLFRLIQSAANIVRADDDGKPCPNSLRAFSRNFGAQIQSMLCGTRRGNLSCSSLIPTFALMVEHLRTEFEARLVTVFAEDRRSHRRCFLQLLRFRTERRCPVPDRASAGSSRPIPSFLRSPPNCPP